MLDYDTYSFFAVEKLPREAWRVYRTLAGPLPVRTARAIAEVNGRQFEVFVETQVYGGGKRLLGRELLNRLIIVLDGHGRDGFFASEGLTAPLHHPFAGRASHLFLLRYSSASLTSLDTCFSRSSTSILPALSSASFDGFASLSATSSLVGSVEFATALLHEELHMSGDEVGS